MAPYVTLSENAARLLPALLDLPGDTRDSIRIWRSKTLTSPSDIAHPPASGIRQFGAGSRHAGCRLPTLGSAAGSSDESGDDVGGVLVEGTSRPVVTHRCPRISMRGSLLDITQGDTRIQGGGDERVPQRMR